MRETKPQVLICRDKEELFCFCNQETLELVLTQRTCFPRSNLADGLNRDRKKASIILNGKFSQLAILSPLKAFKEIFFHRNTVLGVLSSVLPLFLEVSATPADSTFISLWDDRKYGAAPSSMLWRYAQVLWINAKACILRATSSPLMLRTAFLYSSKLSAAFLPR